MRLHVVIVGALLVSCGDASPPTGFGVNLIVRSNELASRDRVAQARLEVTGDEPFTRTVDGSVLRSGELRAHYVPGVQTGTLTFHVEALDTDGLILGAATSKATNLVSGQSVEVELDLSAALVLADAGVDAAGDDLGEQDLSAADLVSIDLAKVAADLAPAHPWTAQSSGTANALFGIWGTSATDVYVVGTDIRHSIGDGTWSSQTSPTTDFRSVWGSAANDIYVVGVNGSILHSTGNGSWLSQTGAASTVSRSVWGSGSTDIYVAYGTAGLRGNVEHSTGAATSWTTTVPNYNFTLTSIWGSAGSDVYIVGGNGTILHFTNSTTYTKQNSNITFELEGVWGSGPTDVYAVGGGEVLHSTGDGVWTPQPLPQSTSLYGVWGSGPNDIYVVGTGGSIMHSTGNGTWTPQVTDTTAILYSIWGSGPNDVYAVGDGGTLLHHP